MLQQHPRSIFISRQCIAAGSRKTLKSCEKFLRFLEKQPFTVKFSKFRVFIATLIDVVVSQFREISQTGNLRNRALFT